MLFLECPTSTRQAGTADSTYITTNAHTPSSPRLRPHPSQTPSRAWLTPCSHPPPPEVQALLSSLTFSNTRGPCRSRGKQRHFALGQDKPEQGGPHPGLQAGLRAFSSASSQGTFHARPGYGAPRGPPRPSLLRPALLEPARWGTPFSTCWQCFHFLGQGGQHAPHLPAGGPPSALILSPSACSAQSWLLCPSGPLVVVWIHASRDRVCGAPESPSHTGRAPLTLFCACVDNF